MLLPLVRHPDTPSAAGAIEVSLSGRCADALALDYRIACDPARIVIPQRAPPARSDRLWLHSCMEAFFREDREAYREFNFSPSTRWAAWRLASYRGDRADLPVAAPHVETRIEREGFTVAVSFATGMPVDRPWWIGISAILEELDGSRSFWALAHPPGEPDFHHRDCFALELPAAQRA